MLFKNVCSCQSFSFVAIFLFREFQKGPDLLRQTAIYNMLQSGKPIEEVKAKADRKHLLSLERYDFMQTNRS